MRSTARLFTTATALIALALPAAGQDRLGRIRVGQPFPDLELPTLDSGRGSIADYRGQRVLLMVFASW